MGFPFRLAYASSVLKPTPFPPFFPPMDPSYQYSRWPAFPLGFERVGGHGCLLYLQANGITGFSNQMQRKGLKCDCLSLRRTSQAGQAFSPTVGLLTNAYGMAVVHAQIAVQVCAAEASRCMFASAATTFHSSSRRSDRTRSSAAGVPETRKPVAYPGTSANRQSTLGRDPSTLSEKSQVKSSGRQPPSLVDTDTSKASMG